MQSIKQSSKCEQHMTTVTVESRDVFHH